MVCLYLKAGLKPPEFCDVCKFGKDCAMLNMFIACNVECDELSDSDALSELSKVLNVDEYNKFWDVLNFLVNKVKKEGNK